MNIAYTIEIAPRMIYIKLDLYKMTLILCLSSRGQLQEPREYMHNDTEIILKCSDTGSSQNQIILPGRFL